MNILDLLDFGDLVALSQANSRFHHIIRDHYMLQKFQISKKAIYLHRLDGRHQDFADRILITDTLSIEMFLSNFGKDISHLVIGSLAESNPNIRQRIEQHCWQSLETFELLVPSNHFSSEINQSFPKLMSLKMHYIQQDQAPPQISRIYPALRGLSIVTLSKSTSLDREMEQYMRQVFASAPPLRAFSMKFVPSHTILKWLNELQPQLQSLAIEYGQGTFYFHDYDDDRDSIRFANVRSLTIDIASVNPLSIPFPLKFDRLERLEIGEFRHIDCIPYDLIECSVGLKVLSMSKWYEMGDMLAILDRVNGTHSIEEVSVVWSSGGGMRSMNTDRLLNDYPKLKKITFSVLDNDETMVQRDNLLGLTRNRWNVYGSRTERGKGKFVTSFVTLSRM